MPQINGKIYYHNVTGAVLVIVNQVEGAWMRDTSFAEDCATFPQLRGISADVISVVRLSWDQYREDFATQRPVAVIDGKLRWEVIDETAPPDETPAKPFSERLVDNENESVITMMALSEAYEMILGLQAQIDALQGGDA